MGQRSQRLGYYVGVSQSTTYLLVAFVVMLFVCIGVSFAQGHGEGTQEGTFFQQPQPITYEAIVLYGDDTTKSTINIHYRIGQSFFIFVRNEAETKKVEYIARGELMVELLDEQKVSAARQIRQISLARNALLKEGDKSDDLQGAMSFTLPKGTYQLVFSVDDRESGRTFLDRNQKVVVRQSKQAALETSHPILVQERKAEQPAESFVSLNRGGNVLFGGRGGLLTQVYCPGKDSLIVQWKIDGHLDGFNQRMEPVTGTAHVVVDEHPEEPGQQTQTYTGITYAVIDGKLKLTSQEGTIHYTVEPSPLPWKVIYLPLPFEKLNQGSYELQMEYSAGTTKQQHVHKFRVLWLAKPLSLMNPELAIDALRHIAKEEEMDDLQSGSMNRRLEAFLRYWKQRDPDTTTAYNELMTEYYLRVDEALRKFSTIKEADGYKTDRGRILILYGAPTKTDRVFQPGGPPMEVWVYDRFRRKFVFIDPNKSGAFILSQTDTL